MYTQVSRYVKIYIIVHVYWGCTSQLMISNIITFDNWSKRKKKKITRKLSEDYSFYVKDN